MSLLVAGLHQVPAEFRGTLLLHGYMTDLALSLRRLDMLERMLGICRRARPRARIGLHTNMAAETLNALAMLDVSVDEVSVLSSPHALNMASLLAAMRLAGGHSGRRLTTEVGVAPALVHRVAAEAPEHWAHGADAVLVGAAAEPAIFRQRRQEIGRDWAEAFPGLDLVDEVL
jgi:hypothetical protein